MLTESIAKRYARALFHIALERGVPDQIAEDLGGAVNVLDTEAKAKEFLVSPRLPAGTKKEILTRVFTGMHEMGRNFLCVLVDKRREMLLPEVLTQYRLLLEEHRKVQPVEVSAVAPLPPAVADLLVRSLERSLQRKVTLRVKHDPDILGGLVIQIGDRRIDGSIKTKLEQIRERLLALPT